MKPPSYSEEALRRQTALVEELTGQTDRGVAIVGTAWVEEAIGEALHNLLDKDQKSWLRLFGASGPLSTLSAKIDLARLLGLMTGTIKSDLHILRDIRNEFAHQIAHKTTHVKLAFSSAHIKDKCLALRCVAHEKHTNPREAFIRACAILNADFQLLLWFRSSLGNDSRVSAQIEKVA
jgi:DNA-binding MltR family transcriptional regulator